jgi:hypothetical protein
MHTVRRPITNRAKRDLTKDTPENIDASKREIVIAQKKSKSSRSQPFNLNIVLYHCLITFPVKLYQHRPELTTSTSHHLTPIPSAKYVERS